MSIASNQIYGVALFLSKLLIVGYRYISSFYLFSSYDATVKIK